MKPEISIATAVGDRAATDPKRIAIRDGARDIPYAAFAAAIDRVALALAAEGLGPSAKVGLEAAGFYAHWVAIMAVARLGGISASLSGPGAIERARLAKLDIIVSADNDSALKGTAPRFVFMDDDLIDRDATAPAGSGVTLPDPARANRALGRIVFSSGTTGLPKAILQPASMVLVRAQAHAEAVDATCKYLCGYGIDTTPDREIGTWFRGGTVIMPYVVRPGRPG